MQRSRQPLGRPNRGDLWGLSRESAQSDALAHGDGNRYAHLCALANADSLAITDAFSDKLTCSSAFECDSLLALLD